MCFVTGAVILKEWKGEMIHILSRRINVGTCVFVFFDRCCRKRTVSEISDPNCQYSDVHSIIQKIKCILRRDSMQGLTTLDEIDKCESRVNHTHRACNTHLWVQVHRQRAWGMQVHRHVAAKARSSSTARGPLDLPFQLTQRRSSDSSSRAERQFASLMQSDIIP